MKAAVLEHFGEPLAVITLSNTAGLGYGQVLIQVLMAGICGSQLDEIDGKKGDPKHLPHLLGHEGCGIVQSVGRGVTKVKPGDKVVMHWRKGSGADVLGSEFGAIKSGPITTFSEYSVVSENRVTRIPNDVPNGLATLLGCALSTALATVEKAAAVKPHDKVLVIGCGGVGLSLILAARMITDNVVGFDRVLSKVSLVTSLGAKFFTSNLGEVLFDVILDTTGNCLFGSYLAENGIYVVIGQTHAIEMDVPNFFKGEGQTIKATQGGGFDPDIDIPRYIQLWRDGKLDDYPKLITHKIKLEEINKGISLTRDGKAGRVLIEMQ